jgi:hypothetical protein
MDSVTIILPDQQTMVYVTDCNKLVNELKRQIKHVEETICFKKAQCLQVTVSEDHQKVQKDISKFEEYLYLLKNQLVKEQTKTNEIIRKHLFKCFDNISNEIKSL